MSVLGTIAIILIIIILLILVIGILCVIRAAGIASQYEDNNNYYTEQTEALKEYNKKKSK